MELNNTYEIYYDEEGDFLEITFGEPPKKSFADEIEPGVFITKEEETNKVTGVGILSFTKRVQVLKRILNQINLKLPLEISIPQPISSK